jgi:hypothetical protein
MRKCFQSVTGCRENGERALCSPVEGGFEMAMAKKSTRRIHVGGRDYRWTVAEGGGKMTVVVEASAEPRQRLHAVIPCDPGVWAVKHVVLPEFVSRCIAEALEAGWMPDKAGPPFVLRVQIDAHFRATGFFT